MRFWRTYHKWAGLFIAFFLLLFSLSGIVLNHREAFSGFELSRKHMPDEYKYKSWNTAALRGSIKIDSLNYLVYGNVGVWRYRVDTRVFSDYNQGFKGGIDNRKIQKVVDYNGRLYAGGLSGLYYWDRKWIEVDLKLNTSRVTDLIVMSNTLYVSTRSEIIKIKCLRDSFEMERLVLPKPKNYKVSASLFKTIWVIHSGEILGLPGELFVDLLGVIFILLSLTGCVYLFFPAWIKRRKKRLKKFKSIVNNLRLSVKWHNKLGVYFISFLVLLTLTGMFLRPPLLIPIANVEVPVIPGSAFDTDNAWFDKLRALQYNKKYNVFLISTSDGFYASNKEFTEVYDLNANVPVSVMGINVFSVLDDETYLVGSFTGLYRWNPFRGVCVNSITGEKVSNVGNGRPIGDYMITGALHIDDEIVLLDYNKGMLKSNHAAFPLDMPDEIIKKSPISLWNLALEIHTCRIFQVLIGDFYILLIPLLGICILLLLFSGFAIWRKYYRKMKRINKKADLDVKSALV